MTIKKTSILHYWAKLYHLTLRIDVEEDKLDLNFTVYDTRCQQNSDNLINALKENELKSSGHAYLNRDQEYPVFCEPLTIHKDFFELDPKIAFRKETAAPYHYAMLFRTPIKNFVFAPIEEPIQKISRAVMADAKLSEAQRSTLEDQILADIRAHIPLLKQVEEAKDEVGAGEGRDNSVSYGSRL